MVVQAPLLLRAPPTGEILLLVAAAATMVVQGLPLLRAAPAATVARQAVVATSRACRREAGLLLAVVGTAPSPIRL